MNSTRLAIVAAVVAALSVAAISAADQGQGGRSDHATAAAKKAKRGAQGPRGPRGPQGPAGPKGAPGARGLTGARGATGTLLTALPSGQTLRGGFGASTSNSGAGIVSAPVTFPVPLSFNPVVRIVQLNGTPPAQCPGTVANPQAAAGNLCVFVGTANNVGSLNRYGMVDGQSNFRFGLVLFASVTLFGNADISGTWAVRAP